MKKTLHKLGSVGLALALLCSSADGRESSPDRQADLLVAQWDALAGDAHYQQRNAAYAGIAMGIPLAIGGGVIWAAAPNDYRSTVGAVGLGGGIGLALGGALSLTLETPYMKPAKDIFPAGLIGQARLDAYEKKFQSLADEEGGNRRFFSVVTGVLGLGATALFIPALGPTVDTSLTALAMIGPALVSASVVLYLVPGPFESRWLSYKKSGLIASHTKPTPSLKLSVSPMPGGGMAVAALRF